MFMSYCRGDRRKFFKKNKTVKEGGAKKKMDRSAESHFEASDKKAKTS